jgi:hypothetical protein
MNERFLTKCNISSVYLRFNVNIPYLYVCAIHSQQTITYFQLEMEHWIQMVSQGTGAEGTSTKNDIQSNLSYVTFQGNSKIWSHKTGGRLTQV